MSTPDPTVPVCIVPDRASLIPIPEDSRLLRALSTRVALIAITWSCLCAPSPLDAADAPVPYAKRKDVQAFIDEVAAKDGLNKKTLQGLMASAVYQQPIIDSISKPAEHRLTWAEYRKIFITDKRVNAGIAFYNTHRDVLKRAQKQYGVAPEIIVGIIGVETLYGERKGNYRVIDALSTLAFDYPPRANFFRQQLREFLLMERETGIHLDRATGSYAGAMGFPQFIPSSYRNFAVDFDSDNKTDLINNPVDAIGSVANYFKMHKWAPGQPVVYRARYRGDTSKESGLDAYVNQALEPTSTLAEANAKGLVIKKALPGDTPVTPMRLEGSKGNQYWLGLNNFYVITRYNHSSLYAMAVYQLSDKIKEKL